jgi:ABC-type ATPase involved in cell division
MDLKRDAVHRVHVVASRVVGLDQVVNLEQHLIAGRRQGVNSAATLGNAAHLVIVEAPTRALGSDRNERGLFVATPLADDGTAVRVLTADQV